MVKMPGWKLKRHQDNVFELYEEYKRIRGSVYDCIDIRSLEQRVQKIKDGKFTLVVAGEVKAGKSTFINALLGAEILPADVLQSTSAIIEISKADTPCVRVTYADRDDHIDVIYDDPATPFVDESREFLSKICSLQDMYRAVPVTLIDSLIIQHDVRSVDDIDIKALEIQSGLQLECIRDIIDSYIRDHSLDRIPVKVQYQYPLKWDFDQLQIVDSPGVNARGGVQDLTFEYIENANAVIFIHPITPIESKSFRDFVDKVISERSKDMLFLVLTHAGLYPDDEVERLHQEAIRLYSDIIVKEKILVVDSLLKLIHTDLIDGKSIRDIQNHSTAKKKLLYEFIAREEEEKIELSELINNTSRFDLMINAIDEFSTRAPLLQLSEIVEKIRLGYGNTEGELYDKISRLELKIKPVQEFEREIARVEERLGEYELHMNRIVEYANNKFSGSNTELKPQWDELRLQFTKKIIEESNCEDDIRKHFTDYNDKIDALNNRFTSNITEYLKNECVKTGADFKATHHISIPFIDLNELAEKAKNESYFQEDVKEKRRRTIRVEGRSFWNLWKFWESDREVEDEVVVGQKTVFNSENFINTLKIDVMTAFNKIADAIPEVQSSLLENYLQSFIEAVSAIIEALKVSLLHVKEEKMTNQEILEEIVKTESEIKSINKERLRTEELLENLK